LIGFALAKIIDRDFKPLDAQHCALTARLFLDDVAV
jgi:hypothetical protein